MGSGNDGYPIGSKLRLEEMFPDFDHLWLAKDGERYLHEFVAGIAPQAAPRPARSAAFTETGPAESFAPGSEWAFAKLYCPASEIDGLIRSIPLLFASLNGASIDRWFFLRYADPQPHLRIRFHTPGDGKALLAGLAGALTALVGRGLIPRYALDTYIPELERYGGAAAMPLAEQLFHVDSGRALEFIASAPALTWESRVTASLLFAGAFLQQWFEHFDGDRWMERNREIARAARNVQWPRVRRIRGMLTDPPEWRKEERGASPSIRTSFAPACSICISTASAFPWRPRTG